MVWSKRAFRFGIRAKFMQSLRNFKKSLVAEVLKAAGQSHFHSQSIFAWYPTLNETPEKHNIISKKKLKIILS